MKSRAPQLHLEYRFYRQLGTCGLLHYPRNQFAYEVLFSL